MMKKILVALPLTLVAKVDVICVAESRTRSGLVREALRRYVERFQSTQAQSANVLEVSKLEEAYASSALEAAVDKV